MLHTRQIRLSGVGKQRIAAPVKCGPAPPAMPRGLCASPGSPPEHTSLARTWFERIPECRSPNCDCQRSARTDLTIEIERVCLAHEFQRAGCIGRKYDGVV